MSSISWFESSPSSASTGLNVVQDWDSMMSSVARGLQPSFAWPGSGGASLASAGESIPGNMRLAVHDSGSSLTMVQGGFGNGFLGLCEQHESLHHIGSTWTGLLGHSGMVDHGGGIGSAPFTSRWLLQNGVADLASEADFGTVTVTFTIPYSVPPFVTLHHHDTSQGGKFPMLFQIQNITTTGFTSNYTNTNKGTADGSHQTVGWESDGTVAR